MSELQKLIAPYRCDLIPAPADGARVRLQPRSGRLPRGWVIANLRPGVRLLAGDGQAIREAPSLRSRGQVIVQLPAQVSELFAEPDPGSIELRELSKAELAARLSAKLAQGEETVRIARGVLQARGPRWPALKAEIRRSLFPVRHDAPIGPQRQRKMERLKPLLRTDLPHVWRGDKADYLSDELRSSSGISATANVSANDYDEHSQSLIAECADGLVLDCGAGLRHRYYENVVNFEIVDYDTTDVLGVGEDLPFADASFEAVLSLSVLEHVRDPFQCAREIARVLKPGGRLICCVPFLVPLHGYPHHYYNMTHQGLRALFEGPLRIDRQLVARSTLPIWSLTSIVQIWARALPEKAREEFLDLPLRSLLASAESLLEKPWVRQLPEASNYELAAATLIFATRR